MVGPSRRVVIATLGVTQIFAWGSSYYLPAVLAPPIATDMSWPLSLVVSGLSLGLLADSDEVGRAFRFDVGHAFRSMSATCSD